jgi:hypothetical protein
MFEAQLGVANTALHFAFAIRVTHLGGPNHHLVVLHRLRVCDVQSWITVVRMSYPFAKIVEDNHLGATAQLAKRLLMQS